MGAGTEEDPKWLCSKPNMYLENGLVPLSYFGQLLENIKSHAFENSGACTATYWETSTTETDQLIEAPVEALRS